MYYVHLTLTDTGGYSTSLGILVWTFIAVCVVGFADKYGLGRDISRGIGLMTFLGGILTFVGTIVIVQRRK